ncbi:MAG: DUF4340 domain-containing protein [Oscillospiraceae bacterium]|nr:DUF4340 domain-containing protein [Oscillospiraceae bacterium]
MSEKEFSEQNETEESQAGMDTFFADAPAIVTEHLPKKGMSKNVKTLIAAVTALVILGGALTAVLLLNKNAEEENSQIDVSSLANELLDDDEKNAVLLNDESAEDLKEIEISNQDVFRVYQLSAKTDDADAVYTIEGCEDIPLDKGYLSTLVNNASSLSADQLVEENPADLSKYGLSEPVSKVVMHYQDGTDFMFSVGSVSPMDSTQTYCAVDGNVYLIKTSLMTNYQKNLKFFFSTTVLEEPDEENYPIVESVRVQRQNLDYDIYMEYAYDATEDNSVGGTAATHVLREPVFAYLNVEKSADVTNGMFGLSAVEIAQIHPSEEDLQKAGIDNPFCTVTMACDDGNTYVLKFGNTYTAENGTSAYYAVLEGTDILYGIAETRAVWATVQPGDITSANIFGTYVWDIASLDVTAGNQKLTFIGEGTEQDDYTVTKNGETCDTERFRQFYKFLLYVYGEELYLDAELPASEPDVSVCLKSQDGKEDYTVSFYKTGGLNAVIAVNGTPTYKIRSSCVDTLLHNIEIFDNSDEEFTMTWQ